MRPNSRLSTECDQQVGIRHEDGDTQNLTLASQTTTNCHMQPCLSYTANTIVSVVQQSNASNTDQHAAWHISLICTTHSCNKGYEDEHTGLHDLRITKHY